MYDSILHVGKFYPPHHGGMETHLYDLATRQAKFSQVSVIVANTSKSTERTTMDGVHVVRCASFGQVASMPICLNLVREIRRHPAKIIHLHTPNPGAALAYLMSGHRGKLVITHHSDTLGREILRKISDPFVYKTMERASAIIATSHRYLESSDELRPFRKKCHVIPLAINAEPFKQASAERGSINDRFGNRLLLAVGRLVPYKGFRYLIEAMAQVDGHLLIIGSGPEEESLKQLATQLFIANKVTFLGRVNDIRPYYQAASAFILPSISRAEAFGIVQLEAMASGIPVINSDLASGVPEVSIHGISGLTVPPCNSTALAAAMQSLLDDPVLHQRLSLGAINRLNSNFLLNRMLALTQDLYKTI